jgi:RNA polymerase sigma-70 factor (ECF subfamily)
MLNLYPDYYGLVRKTVIILRMILTTFEDLINDTFLKLIGKISL